METDEAVIVIGGGVGPMAGVALHAKIIESTFTDGRDQSHLTIHHYSRSVAVPDRTEFLLSAQRGDAGVDNPAFGMADVFMSAARALNDGERAVGGVPCNTFHAPPIFNSFLDELEVRRNPIRIVNMLEETVTLLRERLPGAEGVPVGVLSTTGTRISGVYADLLEAAGYIPIYVEAEDQPGLHEAIYHLEWGIKATCPPSKRAVGVMEDMASRLIERGARAILPACTEIPLALPGDSFQGVPMVDPVLALARGLVRAAAPGKLLVLR